MAKYKLLLPKMGESVAEATVIRWTKNPGDYIEADETVMEIATDKVDSDVPSPVAGKLIEQLYKENDVVQVGEPIAIIETGEPEAIAAQPVAVPEQPAAATKTPAPVEEANPEVHEPIKEDLAKPAEPIFHTPAADAKAAIRELMNSVADPAPEVKKTEEEKPSVFVEQRFSEPVPYTEQLEKSPAEEAAEKEATRFYSPLVKNIAAQEGISNAELAAIPGTGADGRLTKDDLLAYVQNRFSSATIAQPETDFKTPSAEAPVAEVDTKQDSIETPEPKVPEADPISETPVPVVETPKPEPVAAIPELAPAIEAPKSEPVFATPAPAPAIEAPKTEPAKPGPQPAKPAAAVSLSGGDEIIEMDRMRRLIADHMVMSKHTSPHVTSFVEADVTNLVQWREKIKAGFEKREGQKITLTPIFIEAVVRALKDMPMINVQVNGTQIIKKKDINISMATALPSGNLIVPVIKRADELNLIGLTKAVNDLASRARNGKLKPDDTQGGTFTITNVGSFGNVMGTPIINQPQVAILAVGAIKKKPAVIETLQGDMIAIRHMMFLSLSYDHRVVDGALGGSFVRRIADYLENWETDRGI